MIIDVYMSMFDVARARARPLHKYVYIYRIYVGAAAAGAGRRARGAAAAAARQREAPLGALAGAAAPTKRLLRTYDTARGTRIQRAGAA